LFIVQIVSVSIRFFYFMFYHFFICVSYYLFKYDMIVPVVIKMQPLDQSKISN